MIHLSLRTYWRLRSRMIPGEIVGGVGRDDVAQPAQQAPRTDPQAGGDNEPEDGPPNLAVINLSQTGYERA